MQLLPLFVYGTLRQGEANHHLLKKVTLSCRPARLEGAAMYDLGPYPMIMDGEGIVTGELIEIDPTRYEATLRRLDVLEGVNGNDPENPQGLYRRVRRKVHVESSELAVEAWVYLGREETARRGILRPGGDWVRRFDAPQTA
jgi:gamma-glutamylcyclotransferase (GGCT)/AIG2-like uncharacterized protein YtfP